MPHDPPVNHARIRLTRRQRARELLHSSADEFASLCANTASSLGETSLELPLLDLPSIRSIVKPPWLVKSIIPSSSLVLVHGQEACGKSFLVLDMLLSISLGLPFFNRETKTGPVLYLTAEGTSALGDRCRAFLQAKSTPGAAYRATFYAIPIPLNLASPEDTNRLLLAFHQMLLETETPPIAIVIDTFHAYMSMADENSAKDIGIFVRWANELRRLTGATIFIIHHNRKGSSTYRGHSSLAGAVDTSLSITKEDNHIFIKCDKQKDSPPFSDLVCELESVPLNHGSASCVIRPIEPIRSLPVKILTYIQEHDGATYSPMRDALDTDDKLFSIALHRLHERRFIIKRPEDDKWIINNFPRTKLINRSDGTIEQTLDIKNTPNSDPVKKPGLDPPDSKPLPNSPIDRTTDFGVKRCVR